MAHPPRRRWRRLLTGFGIFAVLAAVAGIGGWQVAEANRPELQSVSVTLPSFEVVDYRGLSSDEVVAAVAPYRWTVTITEEFRDGTVPGQILAQSPGPGTSMTYGNEVALTVSLGPAPRSVPTMVGLPGGEVRESIEAAGLTVGVVTSRFDEEVAAEVVLEATIEGVPAQPGTEFLPGTVIDLVVSAGPAPRQVPSIVGLTVEEARTALAEQDLELATAEDFSETVAEGLIISANPEARAEVARGSTVTATVSLGRPFVAVPGVVGMPIREAIDILAAAGFTVEVNGDAAANVLATRPEADASVRSGSTIEIISTIS